MTTQAVINNQRQKIEQLLNALPEDSLAEVLNFLQYLYYKRNQIEDGPYQIVDTFEGIWQDYPIDAEDISQARRELWGKFGH